MTTEHQVTRQKSLPEPTHRHPDKEEVRGSSPRSPTRHQRSSGQVSSRLFRVITRYPDSFVPVACPMTSAECRPWAAGRCSSGLQPFPRPARAHAGPHAGRVGRSRPLISTHVGTAQGPSFSPPIVQLAATASRAPYGRRQRRSAKPPLDPATAHKGLAPARKTG